MNRRNVVAQSSPSHQISFKSACSTKIFIPETVSPSRAFIRMVMFVSHLGVIVLSGYTQCLSGYTNCQQAEKMEDGGNLLPSMKATDEEKTPEKVLTEGKQEKEIKSASLNGNEEVRPSQTKHAS